MRSALLSVAVVDGDDVAVLAAVGFEFVLEGVVVGVVEWGGRRGECGGRRGRRMRVRGCRVRMV
jgi:hypothetical protein